jgi:hypothetical protein
VRVYPAYGRTIAALCARGVKPAAIGVLLSDYWNYYQAVPRVCIRADEWAPRRWEFGFLRNQHAVVIFGDGASNQQFAELLVEIMAAGPRLIWACMAGGAWLLKDSDADPLQVHSYAIESLRGPPTSIVDGALVRNWTNDGWTGPTHHSALPARNVYAAAQHRAAQESLRVMERVQAKGGDLIKWDTEERAQLAFVERMFSDPYAMPDDAAAA